MKLRCDDCHHEIRSAPVKADRNKFCDSRCCQHWKRRMARFHQAQKEQLHLPGDV
jgi:hypothetical protein